MGDRGLCQERFPFWGPFLFFCLFLYPLEVKPKKFGINPSKTENHFQSENSLQDNSGLDNSVWQEKNMLPNFEQGDAAPGTFFATILRRLMPAVPFTQSINILIDNTIKEMNITITESVTSGSPNAALIRPSGSVLPPIPGTMGPVTITDTPGGRRITIMNPEGGNWKLEKNVPEKWHVEVTALSTIDLSTKLEQIINGVKQEIHGRINTGEIVTVIVTVPQIAKVRSIVRAFLTNEEGSLLNSIDLEPGSSPDEFTGDIRFPKKPFQLIIEGRDSDYNFINRLETTETATTVRGIVRATTPAIQTGPTAPSTGTQERNDLDCSGGRMRIHVPQTLLPTHIVTLRDPSCKVASNGSHLLADVGVNECGTTVSFTNDSVIFTNELVATALSGTTAPTIIDYGMNMKDQRVKISCIYPRENRVDFSYVPVMKEAHFYERQYGKLSFDVSQYSDEQFSHAIPHNGLPIGVTLNTELFIDISLRHASHKGVGIMVDSCIATPTSSPADPLWYTVIKDGCPAQQDVRTFASPDVDEFRFSFLVFRFTQAPLQKAGPNLPPTSMVFIHCQVSACPSQNCTNTCNPAGSHRVRREAELENSHLVSAGPFYLKSEEERGGYTGGVVAASVSMAVVATLVAIVALVAWRRSVNKLSKHQTLDEAS